MAKKKKKKSAGKVVHLSPKKYITTKVRNLPIRDCLISDHWQEQGVATVLVVREMPSGKLTLASYLLDTFCLGVKDTTYYHNLTTYELDEFIEKYNTVQDMVSCDYVEAHNIIYGAIGFAADLGFEPHKDFDLTKYYLQEDDERVELIEYEFGREGRPVLMIRPEENAARYISKLDHSVGRGNYEVIDGSEWDDEEWDDEEWDEEEWDEEEWEEDENTNPLGLKRPFRKLLMGYQHNDEPEGGWENVQPRELEIVYHEMDTAYDKAYQDRAEELYEAVEKTYYMAIDPEQASEAVGLLRQYLEEFPEYPPLYNYLYTALKNSKQEEEAREVASQLYEKFPDYLHAKLGMAYELIDQDKPDEAFRVVDEKYNIMDLYPERKAFHVSEILAHSLFMVTYFLEKHETDKAFLYYHYMYSVSEDHPMTIKAESMVGVELARVKIRKMMDNISGDLPED